jgi:hypothetical protein
MTPQVSQRGDEPSNPDGTGTSPNSNNGRKPALGRRALLTRGGVVAAGVVGAGAVAAVAAGPASAQATTPIDMNTANDAGTSSTVTELDADNSTTPALIITNTGTDDTPVDGIAGVYSAPNLRLTPSPTTATGYFPTGSTVGGDLTATADGVLYFTHDFTTSSPPTTVPGLVYTDQIANMTATLGEPVRIFDTRTTAGQTNIMNVSGNLNSSGELLAGKTIYIDMDSQVFFADSVQGNLTIVNTAGAGYLKVWAADADEPEASMINFASAGTLLSNFVSSALGAITINGKTSNNAIAVGSTVTTSVLLDLYSFIVPSFQYIQFAPALSTSARAARLQRAQQQVRAAKAAKAAKQA